MPHDSPSSAVSDRPAHEPAPAVTVLSPHRDDAAFSCGALLAVSSAAALPVIIVNVFTRSAYAPFAPHLTSQEDVSGLRLSEDRAVAALLGGITHLADLHLLDAPLRLGIRDDQVISGPLDEESLREQVQLARSALPDLAMAEIVLAPLALGSHIDHILTRDAALAAVPAERLGFYQDLPYASRTHSPGALEDEIAAILHAASLAAGQAFSPFLLHTSPGTVSKVDLLTCYPSQVAPETVEEMSRWTDALGGELLYLSTGSLTRLQAMLPSAELTPTAHSSPLI